MLLWQQLRLRLILLWRIDARGWRCAGIFSHIFFNILAQTVVDTNSPEQNPDDETDRQKAWPVVREAEDLYWGDLGTPWEPRSLSTVGFIVTLTGINLFPPMLFEFTLLSNIKNKLLFRCWTDSDCYYRCQNSIMLNTTIRHLRKVIANKLDKITKSSYQVCIIFPDTPCFVLWPLSYCPDYCLLFS